MEITTLNDLYKVNKWLEPAVKASIDSFDFLDDNVQTNRENWKQISETVVLIKSVCKTEKVPDKVYFTMLDEAFNKRLTKDMRSKALKFGGYASVMEDWMFHAPSGWLPTAMSSMSISPGSRCTGGSGSLSSP